MTHENSEPDVVISFCLVSVCCIRYWCFKSTDSNVSFCWHHFFLGCWLFLLNQSAQEDFQRTPSAIRWINLFDLMGRINGISDSTKQTPINLRFWMQWMAGWNCSSRDENLFKKFPSGQTKALCGVARNEWQEPAREESNQGHNERSIGRWGWWLRRRASY